MASENIVCTIAVILSRGRWVNIIQLPLSSRSNSWWGICMPGDWAIIVSDDFVIDHYWNQCNHITGSTASKEFELDYIHFIQEIHLKMSCTKFRPSCSDLRSNHRLYYCCDYPIHQQNICFSDSNYVCKMGVRIATSHRDNLWYTSTECIIATHPHLSVLNQYYTV